MAKRENQICITLSHQGLQAINLLKSNYVNISKYISNLVVKAVENDLQQVNEVMRGEK